LAAGFAQLSIGIQRISTISDKTRLTLVKYGASDRLLIAFGFKMTVRVDFLFLKNEYGGQGLQDFQESVGRERFVSDKKPPPRLRERIFLSI
jgi:hypothetical protein